MDESGFMVLKSMNFNRPSAEILDRILRKVTLRELRLLMDLSVRPLVSPETEDGSWWWSSTVWNIYFDCNNSCPGSQLWQCSRLNKIASHAPGLVSLTIPTEMIGNMLSVLSECWADVFTAQQSCFTLPTIFSAWLSKNRKRTHISCVLIWRLKKAGWLASQIYRKSGLGSINLLCVELLVFPYLNWNNSMQCKFIIQTRKWFDCLLQQK